MMNDEEFATRKNIIDSLYFISSERVQDKYQKEVPIADVVAELFCSWDGNYNPDNKIIKKVFNKAELEVLKIFNDEFERISKLEPQDLPYDIDIFRKTKKWKELSKAAKDALKTFSPEYLDYIK